MKIVDMRMASYCKMLFILALGVMNVNSPRAYADAGQASATLSLEFAKTIRGAVSARTESRKAELLHDALGLIERDREADFSRIDDNSIKTVAIFIKDDDVRVARTAVWILAALGTYSRPALPIIAEARSLLNAKIVDSSNDDHPPMDITGVYSESSKYYVILSDLCTVFEKLGGESSEKCITAIANGAAERGNVEMQCLPTPTAGICIHWR